MLGSRLARAVIVEARSHVREESSMSQLNTILFVTCVAAFGGCSPAESPSDGDPLGVAEEALGACASANPDAIYNVPENLTLTQLKSGDGGYYYDSADGCSRFVADVTMMWNANSVVVNNVRLYD